MAPTRSTPLPLFLNPASRSPPPVFGGLPPTPDSGPGNFNANMTMYFGNSVTHPASFVDSNMAPLSPPAEVTQFSRHQSQQKDHFVVSGGVNKMQKKTRGSDQVQKLIETAKAVNFEPSNKQALKRSLLLELPGELRNIIYDLASGTDPAPLRRIKYMASFRERTRFSRVRPLPSDMTLSLEEATSENQETIHLRKNCRPFFGLTQTSRQFRHEFGPLYLSKQEIGINLTEVTKYLETFYPKALEQLPFLPHAKLRVGENRDEDLPYMGKLVICLRQSPSQVERSSEGVELCPLLELWANSTQFDAAFGRYLSPANYMPLRDVEVRDLYRLLGRQLMDDRSCGPMNQNWRQVLRDRELSSVRVHRDPPKFRMTLINDEWADVGSDMSVPNNDVIQVDRKPYIEIIFKQVEAWKYNMEDSTYAKDCLPGYGFEDMEYFDVIVSEESEEAFEKRYLREEALGAVY